MENSVQVLPGGMERTGSDVLRQPAQDQQQMQPEAVKMLKEWQEWIRTGKREIEQLREEWERGDKLYRGELLDGIDIKRMPQDTQIAKKARYNGLKRRIDTSVNQLYVKNPKSVATVLRPVVVQRQVPITDPMGMMQQQMVEEDISEKRAEIVEAVLDRMMGDSSLKAEVKQAIFAAKVHHAGWVQVGYDFDEENQKESVFFRFRSFCEVISDPSAKLYEGVFRNCRYIALRWMVTEEEAASLGIDWQAVKSNSANIQKEVDDDTERGEVWQMWDGTRRQLGFICQHGQSFASEPKTWPWQVDGFPFEVLRFTKDSKKKWPCPPILEAEYLQDEQNKIRETMNKQVVNQRPVNLFDPAALDKNTAQIIANRDQEAWIAVEGMSARPQPPVQIFNDDTLPADVYNHYERNERDMDVVLGVTQNDLGQASKASATEVASISQRAEGNVDAERDILDDFLKRLIRKAKQIMEQTITQEEIIEIVGRDGARYWAPYDGSILAETDVDVEIGSTTRMNPIAKQQLDINMLGVASRVGPALDLPQMVIDTMKAHGMRNADKYKMQPQQQPPQANHGPVSGPGPNMGAADNGPTTGANPAASLRQQLNPMQ